MIGDGDAIPDGEVEGVGEQELLALYRSMVLLRTYDERSVVYHRQGRIGTYAIFWGHEAIQAGAVHALEDEDWIFPSYRESAIGLLRGMPAATVLSWWRGHPAGWWNPADYNLASICVPIAHARAARGRARVGQAAAAARAACALDLLRRRRHLRGRVPRGRQLRRRDARAARPPLQQQPVGDLDAALGADEGRGARRQGGRLRDSRRRASTAATCSRSTRPTREAVARARAGDGPTLHRGGHLPLPRRTRPRTTRRRTSTSSGSRRSARTSASAASRGYLRRHGMLARRARRSRSRPRRPTSCAPGSRPPRPSRRPTPASSSSTRSSNPPESFAHDLAELRRILGG